MGQLIHSVTAGIAVALEFAAALIIAAGALQTIVHALLNAVRARGADGLRNGRRIWMGFAVWLVLGVELTLAADIVHTALAPSWTSIGQLAAVAIIRTGLGRFLTNDIRDMQNNIESHPPTRALEPGQFKARFRRRSPSSSIPPAAVAPRPPCP
jgi:uncharacterized membrane protein